VAVARFVGGARVEWMLPDDVDPASSMRTLLLACALTLSVAACGGGNETAFKVPTSWTSQSTPTGGGAAYKTSVSPETTLDEAQGAVSRWGGRADRSACSATTHICALLAHKGRETLTITIRPQENGSRILVLGPR
jgi:hypothetical protein